MGKRKRKRNQSNSGVHPPVTRACVSSVPGAIYSATRNSDMANSQGVLYNTCYPGTTTMTSTLQPTFSQQGMSGSFIPSQITSPPPLPLPPDPQRHHPPPTPSTDSVIADIYSRLSKLEMLPKIYDRLNSIENKFAQVDLTITEIRNELKEHGEKLTGIDFHQTIVEERVSKLEQIRDDQMLECQEMREQLLSVQTRSMKDNLLFGGIPEQVGEEDTEQVVKDFIRKELDIESDIKFSVVHRLRPRTDRKPRTIVAKFESRKDREMVLKSVPAKLRDKHEFNVNEQFPAEINNRRRELIPVMKEAKRHGKRATLKADKLYIDGRLYTTQVPPQSSGRQPTQDRPMSRDRLSYASQQSYQFPQQDQARNTAPPGATGRRA